MICPKAKECGRKCGHEVPHSPIDCCRYGWDRCSPCVPYTPTQAPEYGLLKPVSIKTLDEAGMPTPILWHFAFVAIARGYGVRYGFDFLSIDETLDCASQVHQCLDWLIDHGFIRVKEEPLKPCPWSNDGKHKAPDLQVIRWLDKKYYVECGSCHVLACPSVTEADARQKWNNR